MDFHGKTDRKKKSDKAKEKRERHGGYSQKHVRLQAALAEKKGTTTAKAAAASQTPKK